MSNFASYLESIDQNMPTKRGELIYIYHTLGKMLFKDMWSEIGNSLYDINDSVYSPQLFGMIKLCQQNFMDKRSEVVNYIFQKTIDKLEMH